MAKKWPTRQDLLSWWIYHKLQESPISDLDDPDSIKKWLIEFQQYSLHDMQIILYAKYTEFRVEYMNPRYAG